MSLQYGDTVRLVLTTVDAYGTEVWAEEAEVPAIVEQNTSWRHQNNQDAIDSAGVIYLDPEDEFVQDNFYRLEGMLVIANLFGSAVGDSWYRVAQVSVYRDVLLSNQIDNVQLTVKKSKGLIGIS